MEGFLFSPHNIPSLVVQLVSQLSCVVITEGLYFLGLARSFPQLAASQPNSFLPSLPALHSSSCLWGLVLACGLAALAGSLSPTSSNPLLLLPAHTRLCALSMLGSFLEGRWGYEEPDGAQWSEASCSDK